MVNLWYVTALFFLGCGTGFTSAQNLPRDINFPNRSLPVIKIQDSQTTVRIGQLEEQLRQLTGRVEELGFQILQMQEQMRQMQQNNEYRLQDLERAQHSNQANTLPENNSRIEGRLGEDNQIQGISGDENASAGLDDESADVFYKAGYAYILAGDYTTAISYFQDYIDQYPDGAQIADAYFWLGEAQYSLGRFNDAASTFLDGDKKFPNSDKGPDNLLKLGMSLFALDERETACVTYKEILTRYPDISKAIKDKIASEQSRAKC